MYPRATNEEDNVWYKSEWRTVIIFRNVLLDKNKGVKSVPLHNQFILCYEMENSLVLWLLWLFNTD